MEKGFENSMRRICISCGSLIHKSAEKDPYVCRHCEYEEGIDISKYWLDK
ncbi:hypothetical protein JW851_01255 [Candidatus Woesearchaeota archaeon]|nr:hypothetical protein [Candidatus Woesearchaeota archaeon]